MNSREAAEKRGIKTMVIVIVVLVITAGLVFFIVNLFTEKTSYISNDSDNVQTAYLSCDTNLKNISNSFFNLSDSDYVKQEIKVVFKDNKIDNVFYNATIKYANNNIAIRKEAILHADYGLYVQNAGRNMNDFLPSFSVDDAEVKIGLYANADQLTPVFSKIFLIDTANTGLSRYTVRKLSESYNNIGFNCEVKNNSY